MLCQTSSPIFFVAVLRCRRQSFRYGQGLLIRTCLSKKETEKGFLKRLAVSKRTCFQGTYTSLVPVLSHFLNQERTHLQYFVYYRLIECFRGPEKRNSVENEKQ